MISFESFTEEHEAHENKRRKESISPKFVSFMCFVMRLNPSGG